MSRLQQSQVHELPEDRAEKLAEMVEPTMLASIWIGAGSTLAVVFWNLFSS